MLDVIFEVAITGIVVQCKTDGKENWEGSEEGGGKDLNNVGHQQSDDTGDQSTNDEDTPHDDIIIVVDEVIVQGDQEGHEDAASEDSKEGTNTEESEFLELLSL